jgi:hypothetical protein
MEELLWKISVEGVEHKKLYTTKERDEMFGRLTMIQFATVTAIQVGVNYT